MGAVQQPNPVLLIIAASSRYDSALESGRGHATQSWGEMAAVSDAFQFTETDYYADEMGPDLKKQFWAFATPVDPGEIAEIKRQTNQWESEYAALGRHPETRPLNLDPGYVTLAKLVLASTKDHAHRVYVGNGIYAEVTLNYRANAWQAMPWTYPDYQRDDFQRFFSQCRQLLQQRLREG